MTINLWAFYRQSGTNVRSLAEIARQEIFKPIPYDDKKLVGLIPYDRLRR